MVDIDGVISLFVGTGGEPANGSFHSIEGIPHFLSATAAAHLLDLSEHFELVWASGWEERADDHLPHLPATTKATLANSLGEGGVQGAHGVPAQVVNAVHEAFVSALGTGLAICAAVTLCGAIAAWLLIERIDVRRSPEPAEGQQRPGAEEPAAELTAV